MPSKGPVIVIDSREAEPYAFDEGRVAVIRAALPAGDYSLVGFETQVAVERKSLADFVNTVIHSRERFHRELTRLQSYQAACVVVEANLTDILAGNYRSKAHPHALVGAAVSITMDWKIPFFFCSDRQAGRLFTERYLLRFYRKVHS